MSDSKKQVDPLHIERNPMLKPWMLETERMYLLTYAEKKERELLDLQKIAKEAHFHLLDDFIRSRHD